MTTPTEKEIEVAKQLIARPFLNVNEVAQALASHATQVRAEQVEKDAGILDSCGNNLVGDCCCWSMAKAIRNQGKQGV